MAKSSSKRPAKPPKQPQNVIEMAPPEAIDAVTEPPEEQNDGPDLIPDGIPPAFQTAGASQKAFPPPPKGQGKGGYCQPDAGMAYWRSLPPEFIARTNIYVNREWPILDRMQELSNEQRAEVIARRRRPPFKYIDKPPDPFGPDTRMEFLQRYGSGEYKVFINDAGVRGAKSDPELQAHTLCKFVYSVSDSDFPPVLDPGRPDKGIGILDRKHPKNASYITDLQARGVLPFDDGEAMQPAGNQQVVKDLADQVRGLAGQLAQGKQEEVLRELREMQAAAKTNGGGSDRMMELVLSLVLKPPAPPTDNGNSVLVTLFQGQVQQLRDELKEEREQRRKYEDSIRDRANQPAPDPFEHFERMIGTFDKAKGFFTRANGGDGVVDTAVRHASKMSGTLEFLSDVIPKIIDAPILTALAQRLAVGPVVMPTAGNPAAPGQAAAPASRAALLQFVQHITPAMLNYLESNNTGADFAEWVYCGFPDKIDELQKQGAAVIVATYQSSPLWPRLIPREIQFREFVDEFCAWKPKPPNDQERPDVSILPTEPEGPEEPIDFDAMEEEEFVGAATA